MKNLLSLGALALLAASCSSLKPKDTIDPRFAIDAPRLEVTAIKINEPIVLDGKLDEAFWSKAPVHEMEAPPNINTPKHAPKWVEQTGPFEGGQVRLAYDDTCLYVGTKVIDTDVIQDAVEDQDHFYRSGDLIEVFIKSENSPSYWEIYGTPNGLRTTFKFVSRGYSRTIWDELDDSYKCAATVQGTLNNYKDLDEGWTLEMAIPIKMIEEWTGVKFTPDQNWTILIARYNYLYGRGSQQYATVPAIPEVNYHLHEYYGKLIFK